MLILCDLLWQITFIASWKTRLKLKILELFQVPVQNQVGKSSPGLWPAPLLLFYHDGPYTHAYNLHIQVLPTSLTNRCPLTPTPPLLLLPRCAHTSSIGGPRVLNCTRPRSCLEPWGREDQDPGTHSVYGKGCRCRVGSCLHREGSCETFERQGPGQETWCLGLREWSRVIAESLHPAHPLLDYKPTEA